MKFITPLASIFIAGQSVSIAAEIGQNDTNKQPNILVILTDDHRADYLGCAGHPIIKTPNIDKLAAEGTYFSNAFVTTSACYRYFPLEGEFEVLV